MIETFRVGSKGGATTRSTNSCTSACEYRSVSANTGEIDQKQANLKPELAQKKKKSASSVATASSSEYAHVLERMGESESHHRGLSLYQLALQHSLQQQRRQRVPSQSRVGRLSSTGGEIVEAQEGHIMRSISRKDRHSKVCTAKGPRDRRVRLAAHTAIQFYDVQDRLGYDRPSKAVDWLIKNAKAAIDQLAELPAWNPTTVASSAGHSATIEQPSGQSNGKQIPIDEPAMTAAFSFDGNDDGGDGGGAIGILPPLDNNSITDTIKSFFPMAAAVAPASASSSPSPIGFRNYPTDILPQTSNHSEDLRLSLQSFKNSIFQHSQSTHHPHNPTPSAYNLFDAVSVGWAEQNRQMSSWFGSDPSGGGGGFGEFAFGAPPLHSALSLSHLFSQRGPLQSSYSPSARDWPEPGELQMHPVLLPSISSIGFTSDAGLSGFSIAGRVQGQEEHGGIANKLPSTSRH